jgi:hypothetical protein
MTPQKCEPGQWTAAPAATTCTDCPLGMFCANHNAPASECQPRTHAMFKKSSICTKTPQGYYTKADYTEYTKCETGTITDKYMHGSSGYSSGPETCFDCPKGYACPGSSWDMITPCPEGSYSEAKMLSCLFSDPGTYLADGRTDIAPTTNDDGYFSDVGFTYQVKCYHGWDCAKEIGAGKFNSGRYNVICPPGHYYDDPTRTASNITVL